MLHYNQITNLIAELLFKHDCVIVPNFGGFVARSYHSNFNKGSNLLYPQSKHILFNKNLIHNDGLLVYALTQKNNMSVMDATKQLEDYKDYIQSLLSIKKRFELTNIGLLYIDAENTLRFEAKADVNFLLESFGLEPVIATELIVEPENPIIAKQFEDRKAIVETVIAPKKKSYAKIATLAVGLPITLAFLLFAAYSKPMKPLLESSINPFYTPEKTYIPNQFNNNKAVIIKDIEKPTLLVDANGYATFKLMENGNVLVASINDSVIKIDKTGVVKPVYISSSKSIDGKYQVVVGCFGVEENAYKLVKELQAKKMNAGISGVNNKGLHVVSCGGFDSKADAANLLSSIRTDFPNAWVMAK